MTTGALDGLTVVALEQAVAAPLATSRLADAGARIIKLERPDGDFARGYDRYANGASSYYAWLNRNKESCRIDLRSEEDRALVRRMIARADVFIQNLAPGAVERLELGSEGLRRDHPALITCDIRGYAAGTPYADRKAYDLMIQAEAGISAITGTAESGPSRVGISICDIATGLTAHAQILEALIARGTTGKGRAISVALFDVAAEIMNIPYIATRHGNAPPQRIGLNHPQIAPYGPYKVRDGMVLIAVQNDHEWVNFCRQVLQRPDLVEDPRFASNALRIGNRPSLDAEISGVCEALDQCTMIARLEQARIAYANISTPQDLVKHGALSTHIAAIEGATIEMIAPPVVVDGQRVRGGEIAALGAHDEAIRAEFAC